MESPEKTRYQGKYIKVTEELKPSGQVIERAHLRDGVSIIVEGNASGLCYITEIDPVKDEARTKLISGYIEDGENPLDCAKRELQEETGYTAKNWRLLHTHSFSGAAVKKQYYFVASDLTPGRPARGKIENSIHVHYTPLDHVKKLVFADLFGTGESAFALAKYLHQKGI